ncbi:hypothetical protein [Halogeometricum sp. CBA1124]|uniref:hypothetical protein n=1 Tax=Halogeometricum sp. CBA1124 TaxID=2668071 RepID=UPI00142A921D|nr:hypothetical protein [Halogeometricum sp. CBA1124]MUV57814.1 hypothetical protein [Halogeometricum sp. CBA1124]
MSGSDRDEYGYTEWICTNCGRSAPKNNPPCDRCGNMQFEQVEVRASDFDDEVTAASTADILRENAGVAVAAAAVLSVVVVAMLASAGVFVVSDPFGLGIRFGAVEAVSPNDDGTLTAAELHGRVAAEYGGSSMRWYGRGLELSYRSDATTTGTLAEEVSTVAVWYAQYVGDGGDADSLELTVRTGDGRARVTIDRADAAAFAAGDITESEYRSRIFQSG